MINNGQSTLLLYCCEDVKSLRSGGDTVLLIYMQKVTLTLHICNKAFNQAPSNQVPTGSKIFKL